MKTRRYVGIREEKITTEYEKLVSLLCEFIWTYHTGLKHTWEIWKLSMKTRRYVGKR